jgi:hypothetical protein
MSWFENIIPDAVISNGSSLWKTETGATFATGNVAKLWDGTTSTEARNSSGTTSVLEVSTSNPAVFGVDRIKRARVVAVYKTSVNASFALKFGGTVYTASRVNVGSTGTIVEVVGPWRTVNPSGTEWLLANLNDLRVWISGGGGFNDTRVFEAYAQMEVQTIANMTVDPVLSPNGKTLQKPSFVWAFWDNVDVQRKFHLKVFSQVVAEGGGFDPDTSATIYNSGIKNSSFKEFTLPNALAAGTNFYVCVKAASDFNGADWWGDWSDPVMFTTQAATTTTVDNPTGTIETTLRPPVTWSITDPNGDAPGAWEVKIFTAAQYGAVGFDPSTSTAYLSASSNTTTLQTYIPETPLVNGGTYRAYVRTTSRDYKVQSAWAFSSFTVNVPVPPSPTIDVLPDVANARVGGPVVGNANLLPPVVAEQFDLLVGWAVQSNCTLAMIDAGSGDWELRIQVTGAGNASARATLAGAVPVIEGVTYSWNMQWIRLNGTGEKQVRTDMVWYNSAGGVISTINGTAVNTASVTPVNSGGTGAAPVGAVVARMQLTVLAGETSQQFRCDNGMMLIGTHTPANLGGALLTRGFGPLRYEVQASSDEGLTWRVVTDTAVDAFLFTDEIPTFNKEMQYRAIAYSSVTGDEIGSVPATDTITLPVGKVWIKNMSDLTMNASFMVAGNWLGFVRVLSKQRFKGLGAEKPKVITGESNYDEFSLPLLILGESMKDKLERLVGAPGSLWIMTGKGNRLCMIDANFEYEEWLWDDLVGEAEDAYRAVLSLVEVEEDED